MVLQKSSIEKSLTGRTLGGNLWIGLWADANREDFACPACGKASGLMLGRAGHGYTIYICSRFKHGCDAEVLLLANSNDEADILKELM